MTHHILIIFLSCLTEYTRCLAFPGGSEHDWIIPVPKSDEHEMIAQYPSTQPASRRVPPTMPSDCESITASMIPEKVGVCRHSPMSATFAPITFWILEVIL